MCDLKPFTRIITCDITKVQVNLQIHSRVNGDIESTTWHLPNVAAAASISIHNAFPTCFGCAFRWYEMALKRMAEELHDVDIEDASQVSELQKLDATTEWRDLDGNHVLNDVNDPTVTASITSNPQIIVTIYKYRTKHQHRLPDELDQLATELQTEVDLGKHVEASRTTPLGLTANVP